MNSVAIWFDLYENRERKEQIKRKGIRDRYIFACEYLQKDKIRFEYDYAFSSIEVFENRRSR